RTLAATGLDNTVVRLWEVATGRELHCLQGHRGRVISLSFSVDGKRLASGGLDTSILIWDLTRVLKGKRPASASLSPEALEALWTDLSSGDAARAYQAEGKLIATPKQTVAFLQDRLRLKAPADVKGIPGLLADLDADDFAVREKAVSKLEN